MLASPARAIADFSIRLRELVVAAGLVELGAHQLQRLLAELVVGELVEHGVDRRLGAAAEQQLRHHAARRDRPGADFLAQRRLGLGGLLREQLRGALGERVVVAAEQRHEPRRDAAGAHVGQRLERDPPHHGVAVAEPPGQRGLDRVVALADRGEHGRRRRAQLDPLGFEQLDDRAAQIRAPVAGSDAAAPR